MKKNYKNISVISTGSWVPTDLNKKKKLKIHTKFSLMN